MTFLHLIVYTKAEGTCYMTCLLLFMTCWGQSHSSNNSQFLFQRPSALSKWQGRKPLNNYIWTAWKCILSISFLVSHCWEVSPTVSKNQRAEWTTCITTKFLPQNTHKSCAARWEKIPSGLESPIHTTEQAPNNHHPWSSVNAVNSGLGD